MPDVSCPASGPDPEDSVSGMLMLAVVLGGADLILLTWVLRERSRRRAAEDRLRTVAVVARKEGRHVS